MQIVIDIDDYVYKKLMNKTICVADIVDAIKNGTPLPKGHGRLIDVDVFQKYCFDKNFDKRLSDGGLATINMFLEFQHIIIEADKGSKDNACLDEGNTR